MTIKLEGTQLFYDNGCLLGEIFPSADGFYYFWPITHSGSWDESVLGQISTLLKEKNKPYEDTIEAYFSGQLELFT